MLKKFAEGLVFGGGFAISFVAVWYLAAYAITPMFASRIEREANKHLSERGRPAPPSESEAAGAVEPGKPFHELGIDEQIKKSSVIALARYERAPDGRMRAIIREFLKKDPNVTIYYNVGDEYKSSSYYPSARKSYGDGIVIFFTGSPATMRMSMTYSGDRIGGLGDIPLELFRNKCKGTG
ncbi:MAG TPA: hypothetical protein VFK92_14940 [Burkholderiales bacterium]|nr:hypothetical protein [Burkholderiales bacterium]